MENLLGKGEDNLSKKCEIIYCSRCGISSSDRKVVPKSKYGKPKGFPICDKCRQRLYLYGESKHDYLTEDNNFEIHDDVVKVYLKNKSGNDYKFFYIDFHIFNNITERRFSLNKNIVIFSKSKLKLSNYILDEDNNKKVYYYDNNYLNLTIENMTTDIFERGYINIDYRNKTIGNIFIKTITNEKQNGSHLWNAKCLRCDEDLLVIPSKIIETQKYCKKCSHIQIKGKNNTNAIKHGMYNTRLYRIYSMMKRRCYSEDDKSYKNYGYRGIAICNEWIGKDGFINFYEWSIKNNYEENLSVDRIDTNGNYEPSNCRWITMEKQQINKNDNLFFIASHIDGRLVEGQCLSEFARNNNLTKNMVFNYIYGKQSQCNGWHIDIIGGGR